MKEYNIDESFETLIDSLEFYKLFYEKISKFRSLNFSLTLKWEFPYRVYGHVTLKKDAPIDILDEMFKTLEQ